MKNKKTILGMIMFLFAIIGFWNIPQTKADTGQYEQRTDPSNPFIFSVDTIYITLDGDLHTDVGQNYYHQVFLEANKYYLYYDPVGYMTMEGERIWIHSAISTSIDYYYEYVSEDGVLGYILYINPSETGLYNIIIRSAFGGGRSFSGIGVLEIPIIPLDTEMSSDYWDFYRDPIVVGIIELDSQIKYQTGHDGKHHDYLGIDPFYYANINSLSYTGYEKLDGSHDVMDYGAFDIITTDNLGQGEGKYLFYSLSYNWFSLMEAEETGTNKPDNFFLGWLIIILPTIAVVIIVVVVRRKHKRKFPKEDMKEDIEPEIIPIKVYCPECGTEILDKSKMFCPNCGKTQ